MIRRSALFICTLLVVAVMVPVALAATPDQIFKDAADGSIDGDYSLSDLRRANGQISADQREYFLWDEMYAAAVARANNPNAPKPPKLQIVRPADSNGNGTIDEAEIKEAAAKTKAANAKKLEAFDEKKSEADKNRNAGDDAEAEPIEAENQSATESDDDGAPWPLIILVTIVVLIAGVGTWRVIANSKRQPGAKKTEPKKPGKGPRK